MMRWPADFTGKHDRVVVMPRKSYGVMSLVAVWLRRIAAKIEGLHFGIGGK